MARNKSGGFNKLLNFIGLVDDEDTQDTYGEEYSSDNYGRRAAYTPARQQRTSSVGSRSTPARTSGTQRRLPENNARSSRYDNRAPRGYDDYRTGERRTASRFDDSSYAAPPRAPRQSRYSEQPDPRYSGRNLPQRVSPQRSMRVSQRSRTVMYSLHSLEDCCEVIDQLIANNTVVLTMDELDGHLLQRAVDTLSGAVFALHASIRKASDRTYLVAPMSVEVNDTYDLDRRF